jgi:hypothetical protein
MDNIIKIIISKDLSPTPGPRKKSEGDFSGQFFRETILEPAFEEAKKNNKKIIINLDGTLGYGTSFLEEVFGGLQRKYSKEDVMEYIEIISKEEPYLIDDIKQYVKEANQ